jgi:hypothetical protein
MVKLSERQIIEYFHRCYTAIDGLWFMKVEEENGFNSALKIDEQVWKVMPKIQARMMKSMLDLKEDPDSLLEALKIKLQLDGFIFKIKKNKYGFNINIIECPWHKIMIKSGRAKLSGIVGSTICKNEYPIWISEFGGKMQFNIKTQICKESKNCIFVFNKT